MNQSWSQLGTGGQGQRPCYWFDLSVAGCAWLRAGYCRKHLLPGVPTLCVWGWGAGAASRLSEGTSRPLAGTGSWSLVAAPSPVCEPFSSPGVISEGRRLGQGFTRVPGRGTPYGPGLSAPLSKGLGLDQGPQECEMPGVRSAPAWRVTSAVGPRAWVCRTSLGGSWHCVLSGRLWKNCTQRGE